MEKLPAQGMPLIPRSSRSRPASGFFRAALRTLLRILPFLLVRASQAELIYDNSINNRQVFISLQEEFGDEIDFAGVARSVSSMTFSVVGETNLPPTASARFRVYKNNGPILPFENISIRTPGELLFESTDIPISTGTQAIRITNLNVPVPDTVTWTILIKGAGTEPGTRAGLEVYHPANVGASFKDYWVRTPDGFELRVLDSAMPASFAARFEAIPDPPVSLNATNTPDGTVVRLTGPIGTDQILESSTDNLHWRTLAIVRLSTVSEGSYFDTSTTDGRERFYRARPSPYPGSTVILKDIQRGSNGRVTVSFVGPRNTVQLLEVSDDGLHWKHVDVLYFFFGAATYEDTVTSGANRFYRTSHPTGKGPVYLVRGIRAEPDGTRVLACSGLPSLDPVIVEASSDLRTWEAVGELKFITPQAEFRDTSAKGQPARVYRLRR